MAVAGLLGEDHVAGEVVRVFHDVACGVDATGRHLGGAQGLKHAGHRTGDGPGLDGGVDLLHPPHTAGVVGQRRVGGQVITPDALHQPLEDAVAVAGDQHHTVGAAVGVGGRDARQGRTGRLAHRAKGAVLGYQAFHDVEHRFMERHVDHLALAPIDLAVVEGSEHTDGAVQGGQGVADGDAAAHGHPAGLAGEVAETSHGLADGTKPG